MSNAIRLFIVVVLACVGFGACTPDLPIGPGGHGLKPRGHVADLSNLTSDSVLFSQASTSNTLVVQEEALNGSTYIADDFVVPDGQVWTVTGIVRSGNIFNLSNLFFLFRDSANVPHGAVSGTPNGKASDPASCCDKVTDYLTKYVDGSVKLPAGRYWVASQWTVSLATKMFGWQPAVGSGLGPVVSSNGATTWTPLGGGVTGLAFSVVGRAQLTQSITFPAIVPNPAPTGTSATLGATASSNLSISYSTSTGTICEISGNTVQFKAPGECIVAADEAGNAKYAAAEQVTQSVDVVALATQTITFLSTPPSPAYVGGTYATSATGGNSGNPVVISVSPESVCKVSNGLVTFVGVGTCTIAANQAGNAAFTAAPQVTQTVKIDYRFDGFIDPVKNGVVNVSKTGKTIALKWRLTDASGVPIVNLVTAAITVTDLRCTLGTTANQLEENTAGNSGLQNLGDGYYQFNWKVPSAYSNSCKTLQLDLGEGSGSRTAQFQFTK